MLTTSRAVRCSSTVGLNSEQSKSDTFGWQPAAKAMSRASAALKPYVATQETPGQSAPEIESMSNETKISFQKENVNQKQKPTIIFLIEINQKKNAIEILNMYQCIVHSIEQVEL